MDGIRVALEYFLAIKPTFKIEVTALQNADESVALTRASWSLVGTDANGEPIVMAAKSTEVVRRQADGTWLYAIIAPGAD